MLWEGSPNVHGDEGENGVSRAYQLDQHYLGELRESERLYPPNYRELDSESGDGLPCASQNFEQHQGLPWDRMRRKWRVYLVESNG